MAKIIFKKGEEEKIIKDYKEGKSIKQIGLEFKVDSRVINRVLKENGIEKKTKRYSFNKDIFQRIDTEEKAYWLGFIWCDGYNNIRHRNNNTTYEFKIELMESDYKHLEKFVGFIEGNYPIKFYNNKNSFSKTGFVKTCRVLIANTYFGKMLDDKFGLIPHREDSTKVWKSIPAHLKKHFIRGVIDADGAIYDYIKYDKRVGESYSKYAIGIHITTYKSLIDYINIFLYEKGISTSKLKPSKRHENRDEFCMQLTYSGNENVSNILNYLYKDATIYLDRKYEKYLEIKENLK